MLVSVSSSPSNVEADPLRSIYSTQEIKIIASSKPIVVAKTENYNRLAVCARPIVSLFLAALPLYHHRTG
jgi:hypothetical protein